MVSTTQYAAADVPFDFRRPLPVWQVALADGTHVYIGTETGRSKRSAPAGGAWFDFMWGLHIMDLQTREDTHHPVLVFFASPRGDRGAVWLRADVPSTPGADERAVNSEVLTPMLNWLDLPGLRSSRSPARWWPRKSGRPS